MVWHKPRQELTHQCQNGRTLRARLLKAPFNSLHAIRSEMKLRAHYSIEIYFLLYVADW